MPGYYDAYNTQGREGGYRGGGTDSSQSYGYGGNNANGSRYNRGGADAYGGGAAMGGNRYGMSGNTAGGHQSRAGYGAGAGAGGYGGGRSASYDTSQGRGASGSYYGAGASGGAGGYGGGGGYNTAGGYGGAASGYRGASASPWESGQRQDGMLPTPTVPARGGGGEIAGAVTQLQQMGNPESKLALNILNAVLAKKGDESASGGDWGGAPPNKMRRMDWDGSHGMSRGQNVSSSMRKYPQRDQAHRVWDSEPPHLAMASRQINPSGYQRGGQMRRGARRGNQSRPGGDRDQQRGKRQSGPASAKTPETQKAKDYFPAGSKSGDAKNGVTEDAAKLDVPIEALKCHMCNLNSFKSVGAYIGHLQSKEHSMSSNAYHLQGQAILNLLRIESKVASQRQLVKKKHNTVKESNLTFCSKCQCRVVGNMEEHGRTIEHQLVLSYMKVKCCGKNFNLRGELEEHRLTLNHLKNEHTIKKNREENNTAQPKEKKDPAVEGVTEDEALQMFKDAAAEHRERDNNEPHTPESLPEYDSEKAVGMHLLGIRSHYQCKVCTLAGERNARLDTASQVLKHFRSFNHYQNLTTHIINQQIEKKLKKKEANEEKKAAEEAEKAAAAGENKDGDDKAGEKAEGDVEMEEGKEVAEGDKEEQGEGEEEVMETEGGGEEATAEFDEDYLGEEEEGGEEAAAEDAGEELDFNEEEGDQEEEKEEEL